MPSSRNWSSTRKRCSSLATMHGARDRRCPASASAAGAAPPAGTGSSLPPMPSARNCFGMQRAASGHRRVPLPPARITGTTVSAAHARHGACPPGSARSLRSAEICERSCHVLAFLARQERLRQAQPVADAARRQHVEVAELVVAALEVLRLDPALGEQRLQQVVRLAEADAELARELALRVLGVLLEQAQQGDGGVFVGGGELRDARWRSCVQWLNAGVYRLVRPASRRLRKRQE